LTGCEVFILATKSILASQTIDEVDGKKTQAGLLKSVMSKFEPMSDSELGSFPVKDCCYGTPHFGLELRGALS